MTGGGQSGDFDVVLVSSLNHFYDIMKFLESKGCTRSQIIDGRIFRVINFDLQKLLSEGIAYGFYQQGNLFDISQSLYTIYPRVYCSPDYKVRVEIGTKSFISGVRIEGTGSVTVGKYCSISWAETFELSLTGNHNPKNVSTYDRMHLDAIIPKEFVPPVEGDCNIKIGSDVWIGRGCCLKSANPKKNLTIGNGAIIAADSVVVKDVPPYAVAGGNPAKIIKYRFPKKIIESLLRIKWWDWDIDKIYESLKYWNNIENFVRIYDKR